MQSVIVWRWQSEEDRPVQSCVARRKYHTLASGLHPYILDWIYLCFDNISCGSHHLCRKSTMEDVKWFVEERFKVYFHQLLLRSSDLKECLEEQRRYGA